MGITVDPITVKEAAEFLQASERAVRDYHQRGLLPGRRVGKRMIIFWLSDVENFIKPAMGRPKGASKKKRHRP